MRIRKFAALAASLGVIAAFGASVPMSAGAEGYTAITGGEVTFDKYLVMDKDATTPNVSFTYDIAPGTAKAATDTTQAIIAGPAGAKFKHVDGDSVTVKQIASTSTSAYYFWTALEPAADGSPRTSFEGYEVREVILGGTAAVSAEGTVTGYSSLKPLKSGDKTSITATRTLKATPKEKDAIRIITISLHSIRELRKALRERILS